jgi:hypothetical protein
MLTLHLIKPRSRAAVARRAHNPKVGGSIPPFATKKQAREGLFFFEVVLMAQRAISAGGARGLAISFAAAPGLSTPHFLFVAQHVFCNWI